MTPNADAKADNALTLKSLDHPNPEHQEDNGQGT